MDEQLEERCNRIRRRVLSMTQRAGSSHIGSNYSIVELLAVLYNGVLKVDPDHPAWQERDRFILSKGHGCAALYAILAERGFFPEAWLDTFYLDGSPLGGHVTQDIPGVEAATGSLGHGLPMACGMALAGKRDGRAYRVFALLSDGECDEGSTWEAALFAAHHRLDNLAAIVDCNRLQALGNTEEILRLEPLAAKWRSFGWSAVEVDGHDSEQIERALASVPFACGRPSCLVARTVKGKGVSFMENQVLWHYRSPQGAEFEAALKELEAGP